MAAFREPLLELTVIPVLAQSPTSTLIKSPVRPDITQIPLGPRPLVLRIYT